MRKFFFFFFSSRRRHTRSLRDWSSDVCSSDLPRRPAGRAASRPRRHGPDQHRRHAAGARQRPRGRGRAGRPPRYRAARAGRPGGLSGGGVHGPDPRRRRLPAAPDNPRRKGVLTMATATGTAGSPDPAAPTPSTPIARPPAARPLGPDLVRAEWTKLRTVRSTWWALALTMVGMVVLGALFCARYGIGGISPADRASFDPAAWSLSGFFLAQLAVGVLGVLAVTSEYATGSIRATLAATAVVVGLVFILPGIVGALPSSWETAVTPDLLSDAGQALIGRTKFAPQGLHLLSPWVGFAVVCAYAAAALATAAVVLRRRDA